MVRTYAGGATSLILTGQSLLPAASALRIASCKVHYKSVLFDQEASFAVRLESVEEKLDNIDWLRPLCAEHRQTENISFQYLHVSSKVVVSFFS